MQANWPFVLYPAAAIAAAGLFEQAGSGCCGRPWRLGSPSRCWSGCRGAAAPLPLPARWDPTLLRLGGWNSLLAAIDAARRRTDAPDFVAAENYGDAAILARALPADVPVLGVDARWSFSSTCRMRAR